MAKRRKNEPSKPDVNDDADYQAQFYPQFDDIAKRLGHLGDVEQLYINDQWAFSVSFVSAFMADQPSYEMGPNRFGASRSNWTYHTALAIMQTCKLMDLNCKFETLGKRDAIIELRSEPPEPILVAEWEWDYEDIFGPGKELEKLQATCQQYGNMDAFLLTYCPSAQYAEFVQRVAEYWIGSAQKQANPARLFFHTVLFDSKGSVREFERLRTALIDVGVVQFWNDQLFGDDSVD